MADKLDGWWYAPQAYLTQEHRRDNAKLVYKFFSARGWSYKAICAMLGNMETESSINPGLIQGRQPTLDPDEGGYGLTQWDPASKLINWAESRGLRWENDGNTQCQRIQYEMENELQWIKNENMTFYDFAHSNDNIEYLVRVFCRNYERPTDPDYDKRISDALKWYRFLRLPIWLYFKFNKGGLKV